MVAGAALLVATASATQDIVIDAFRVEDLDENEQAAGMASYVAAYRVGMLSSTAGALYVVSGFEVTGHRQGIRLVARLCRDGGALRHRHRHDAAGDRAQEKLRSVGHRLEREKPDVSHWNFGPPRLAAWCGRR